MPRDTQALSLAQLDATYSGALPDAWKAPSYRRRQLLRALSASGAFLVAPPFVTGIPLTRSPPVLDQAGLLRVPPVARNRPPGWLADLRIQWADFLQRYVHADGRVIDTHNRGVSHSEGQGSALLMAAEVGDLPNFERIFRWTQDTLRCRSDSLYAWRYRPDAMTPVADRNNATDGDILIAWALQRAAERFSRPDFEVAASYIARDILSVCTRRIGQRLLLLPGAQGFEKRDHLILNPSYYIWPALIDFERLVNVPDWRQLVQDGLETCCRTAAFGRWSLPADWIEVPHDIGIPTRMAADKPPRFSWDAIRVPLNLAWGRRWGEPMLHASASFWREAGMRGSVPAWTDLRSDALSPYPGHAGIVSIARLVEVASNGSSRPPALPNVKDASDYYGAALTVMTRIAWNDARLVGSPGQQGA